ncbi:nucleotidyltransferase domain-containing protein [Bacillus sp. JJ1562]|uniref:nucleotidyltransferase domain-containing protein n=1 Tax=Bacillus sp. JJ1562 TaxID=3122960 RepID=UPI0030032C7B
MKSHILKILNQIQMEYEVKILYACEAGSRTWGIASDESDYDVRFIYIHKTEWYLSIDQKRDVLEIPKHDKILIPVNPVVDMSGWELTKALRLFRKSNPALLEWLHSNIIYYEDNLFINKMKQIEHSIFSPIPSIYQYVKVARGNFKTIQEKEPHLKTYLNVIRPLLMAKSIVNHHKMISLDLNDLISNVLPTNDLKRSIEQLIKMKSSGQKLTKQIRDIDKFIETEIQYLEQYVSNLESDITNPTPQLNQLFRETLTKTWHN